MARISYDEFTEMLDEIVDTIPERFCRDLNGGFNALPDTPRDGPRYILGQYIVRGPLGSMIAIYYGSFAAVLGEQPREAWLNMLADTVHHEMQHHLGTLAGHDELARQELREALERKRRGLP
ncbi:MAG: metallopeptidase family protein [Candidatus Saccharibacteria bacterium]